MSLLKWAEEYVCKIWSESDVKQKSYGGCCSLLILDFGGCCSLSIVDFLPLSHDARTFAVLLFTLDGNWNEKNPDIVDTQEKRRKSIDDFDFLIS